MMILLPDLQLLEEIEEIDAVETQKESPFSFYGTFFSIRFKAWFILIRGDISRKYTNYRVIFVYF